MAFYHSNRTVATHALVCALQTLSLTFTAGQWNHSSWVFLRQVLIEISNYGTLFLVVSQAFQCRDTYFINTLEFVTSWLQTESTAHWLVSNEKSLYIWTHTTSFENICYSGTSQPSRNRLHLPTWCDSAWKQRTASREEQINVCVVAQACNFSVQGWEDGCKFKASLVHIAKPCVKGG